MRASAVGAGAAASRIARPSCCSASPPARPAAAQTRICSCDRAELVGSFFELLRQLLQQRQGQRVLPGVKCLCGTDFQRAGRRLRRAVAVQRGRRRRSSEAAASRTTVSESTVHGFIRQSLIIPATRRPGSSRPACGTPSSPAPARQDRDHRTTSRYSHSSPPDVHPVDALADDPLHVDRPDRRRAGARRSARAPPPSRPISPASRQISARIRRRVAPSARRIAISRMRRDDRVVDADQDRDRRHDRHQQRDQQQHASCSARGTCGRTRASPPPGSPPSRPGRC